MTTDLDLTPALRLHDVIGIVGLRDLNRQGIASILRACDDVLEAYWERDELLAAAYYHHARAVIAFLVHDGAEEIAGLTVGLRSVRVAAGVSLLEG